MAWTEQQQKTIDVRDHNILVAAAAGSGKTAVLVERIQKMVTEEDVPIDSMLIVTFTNAAAAEMKEKIRRALKTKAAEHPEDRKCRAQLDRLPGAAISTFHSFALSVIRNFFYLIDLEPDFSICDEAQGTVLLEEALDELLEEYYEEGSPAFYQFMDWYGTERGDEQVRNMLRQVYRNLLSLADPFGELAKAREEIGLSEEAYMESRVITAMKEIIFRRIALAEGHLRRAVSVLTGAGLDRLAAICMGELDVLERAGELAEAGDYSALGACLSAHKYQTLRAKKDEKESYDPVKEQVKSLRNLAKSEEKALLEQFFTEELSAQLALVRESAPLAETLDGMLHRLDAIFSAKKRENKKVDFSDIEHLCLSILQKEEAASFYRKKFQYIFVDEYQDTSILQETILTRICRENNLFMVGDIKQSIYKFRLAEPEIFQRRYERYRAGKVRKSMKIDLNWNFRSKPAVLAGINAMFEPIMDGYDEDARLYPGIPYEGEYSFAPKLYLIDTAGQEDADEAIRDLKAGELEALEVCRLIQENLGRPYYDSKTEKVRHLRYRDIVILMRSVVNSAPVYVEAMKACGIPLFVDDADGYFDTMEVNVFLNLLRVIDNQYRDVPLISVLRSEIFGFSTDELAEIRRLHPRGSYAEGFWALAADETCEAEVAGRCREAAARLHAWKTLALAMPLPQFVWHLLTETGYYLIMGAMPDGVQRQANLRALVDKTESFCENGQQSLFSLLRYIDSVRSRNVKTGQVRLLSEKDDVVRIMTIHKSKGLEFPMVITAGMGRRLNYTRSGGKVVFHKDIGLGMYYEDPERHLELPELPYHVIMDRLHREEAEENIRVLYVALTRAREFLFMTGTVADAEKYIEDKEIGLTSDGTYLGMLANLPAYEIITPDDLLLPPAAAAGAADAAPQAEACADRLAYRYPYPEAGLIRSKYSVSALNRKAHQVLLSRTGEDAEEPEPDLNPESAGAAGRNDVDANCAARTQIRLAEPLFMTGEQQMTAAQRGTIYHGFMERIDFSRAFREGVQYLEGEAEDFVRKEIFTDEEVRAVDLRKITAFFHTPLGQRCVRAFERGELFREQSFNLRSKLAGEEILIQGIIDCCFLEEGKAVLIDYKTNWIDRSRPFEEEAERLKNVYGEQIRLYREALAKALGVPVDEAYLYLFSAEACIEVSET